MNGHTYQPESISRTEIRQSQEKNSGEITVTLGLENPVAQLFAGMLPPKPVSLVIFRGQHGEPEITTTFLGVVASAPFKETAQLKVVPEQDALKLGIPGITYQSQCPRVLFSTGCGVSMTAFMVPGTLAEVDGLVIRSAAFSAKPDGYFRAGWVDYQGVARVITSHVGNALALMDPIPGLDAGAVVVAYPGCQGSELECADKFGNLVNFLGLSHIPSVNPFGSNGVS